MSDPPVDAIGALAVKRSPNPAAMRKWIEAVEHREGESADARELRLAATYFELFGEPLRKPQAPREPAQRQLEYEDEVPF